MGGRNPQLPKALGLASGTECQQPRKQGLGKPTKAALKEGLPWHTQANVLEVPLEGMLSFYAKRQSEIDAHIVDETQQPRGREIRTRPYSFPQSLPGRFPLDSKAAIRSTKE